MIELLAEDYVCAAISCGKYQWQKDDAGEFFRKIAEQGHYAGRTKPTNTRQGLYIATPDGELLTSKNTNDHRQVTGMLNQSLRNWKSNYADKTYSPVKPLASQKNRIAFPENGLVLRETFRDLPRPDQQTPDHWRHNFDYVWLTREEALSFIPGKLEVGIQQDIAGKISERLARFHLLDHVRGEASVWDASDIKNAQLRSTLTKVTAKQLEIEISGAAKITHLPKNERNPYFKKQLTEERGMNLRIVGRVVFDRASKTFTKFDLVAFGDRWGTDVYNFRFNDMGPAPIGMAFELVDSDSKSLTRPAASLWNNYFE